MRKRNNRVFRGGICGSRHLGHDPTCPRRNVDDTPITLSAHCRQNSVHTIQHTIEICSDDLVPSLEGYILPTSLRQVHSGAIDKQINSTVVCTENLSSGVVVVKSAKDGM